ncbi:MAG: hypothetical protein WCD08_04110 [Steroidobacteraceae bacterium]
MFPRRLRRHRSNWYCALSLIATAPLLGAAPSAVSGRNASLPFAADGGALDRWSAVSKREAGNCPFKSFETSAGPPVAAKKNKAAPPAAVPPAGTTPQ